VYRTVASYQNLTRDFLSAFESALHVHLRYRNDQSATNNEVHARAEEGSHKGEESYQPSAERQFSDVRLQELPTTAERF